MPINKTGMTKSLCVQKKVLLALAVATALTGCGGSGDDGDDTPITAPQNQAPTANAGQEQTATENTTVALSGTGTDADGSIASYSWTQISGDAVTLSDASSAEVTFTAPDVSATSILEFTLTVTDDEGATHSDTVMITIEPVFAKLTDLPVVFSENPTQNKEITVSLLTDEDVGVVTWEVSEQPDTANLALDKSNDNKSVAFTAVVPGDYHLVAKSQSDSSQKEASFIISPEFAFDEAKILGNDEGVNVNELISVITNQAWVYSTSLTEAQLREVVQKYTSLMVVGYDSIEGLLIEFDETDITTKEDIELLKLEEGVSSVENRLYEGESAPRTDEIMPNDGSSFSDGGDNWHLEEIDAPLAWEYSTGSADVLIGVSDAGFDISHKELKNRTAVLLTSKENNHGNGSAGVIGANTDNEAGMSGVNWTSRLVLGLSGSSSLKTILTKSDVVTVNSSWSIPGHLPASFDPTSSASVTQRNTDALARTRAYRKLAKANLDKLLVWSAGNGIGNGAGNSDGAYGVDGRHHSPALHYSSNGSLQKQENVLFVAAMRDDHRLSYYSNYGEAVEIAAPTSFKSLQVDNDYYTGSNYGDGSSGYIGTSASAPVVTGVASLVYSLYPGFTGKEVKNILISSATEYVDERYIAPGAAGEGNENIAALANPIPILNANKALEKAQQIIDSKVTVIDTIPDPFVAQARIKFDSIDDDLTVVGVAMQLQSTNDGGASWEDVNSIEVEGDVVEPELDTSTPYQRIVATVTLRDNNDNETTASKEYEFSYSTVDITTLDTVTLAPLVGVEISTELLTGQPINSLGLTGNTGSVKAFLKAGEYKIRGTLSEYQTAVTLLTKNDAQSQKVSLNMAPKAIGSVGSLSGQIVDVDGQPVADTSVRISGGEQTNGFFATATTDADGYFSISNISKEDSNGNVISSFILEASAFGYATVVKEEVIVLAGKDRIENFTLLSVDLSSNTLYANDFEQGVGDWQATGLWNPINLTDSVISNVLVDSGYTLLAPDETGPHALLPAAYNGKSAWWYGDKQTGSFIGTQSSSDSLLSGGRSTSSNAGHLTSGIINLMSATTPYLRFRTWWEIESVNPNENGYDIMEIQISTDGGTSFNTIKKLNPFVDPNDLDREPKPFSSGGYNRKPVWALEEINLSEYAGKEVFLRFNFMTNDGLYNGFRGWIIDTLEVIDYSEQQSEAAQSQAVYAPSLKLLNGKQGNGEQQFFKVHKNPQTYSNKSTPRRD